MEKRGISSAYNPFIRIGFGNMLERESTDAPTVDIRPLEDFLPMEMVIYEFPEDALFGDKNQKGRPPPKISGTEHKWREQKQQPKKWIRIPWIQPKTKTPKVGG